MQSNTDAALHRTRKSKGKWIAVVLITALVIPTLKLARLRPEVVQAEKRDQIVNEIAAADEAITGLSPDHSGSLLAYKGTVSNELSGLGDEGYTVGLVDLKTLVKQQIPGTNLIKYLSAWSPDDRYLAFTCNQVPDGATQSTSSTFLQEYVRLYDRRDRSIHPLTSEANLKERGFEWLSDRDYLVAVWRGENDHGRFHRGNLESGVREKIADYWNPISVMTTNTVSFPRNQQLYVLELAQSQPGRTPWDGGTNGVLKISNFDRDIVRGIEWPNYSTDRSNFLFCSRPKDSIWRYLYQFDPTGNKLTQLSHEDTYNGQWLLHGQGFAYIINTNDSFQLAIRTFSGTGNTNLFMHGNVVLYRVSPGGERVYAFASLGCEPHGLWEYTLSSQSLRKVAEGVEKPFRVAKIVEPRQFVLKSFDGVENPCFLFPPVIQNGASTSAKSSIGGWLHRKAKRPVVIHIPATTYQFQRRFDHQAELFSNLGFYFATINYRGCDGYGRQYSSLANVSNAARDVLNLYQWLTTQEDVDASNIFLTTTSAGTAVLNELLVSNPDAWAGVAIDKPGVLRVNPRYSLTSLPPMLVILGGQEPSFNIQTVDSVRLWAKTNKLDFSIVIHTNSGHITHSVAYRRDVLRQMAYFFSDRIR